MASMCLHALTTTSGYAPNEMADGVLGDLLPDLDLGHQLAPGQSVALLGSVGYTIHDIPEVFVGFRSGSDCL